MIYIRLFVSTLTSYKKYSALDNIVNGEFVRFQVAFLPEVLIAQIAIELGCFVAFELHVLVHGGHVFVPFLATSTVEPCGVGELVLHFVIKPP